MILVMTHIMSNVTAVFLTNTMSATKAEILILIITEIMTSFLIDIITAILLLIIDIMNAIMTIQLS